MKILSRSISRELLRPACCLLAVIVVAVSTLNAAPTALSLSAEPNANSTPNRPPGTESNHFQPIEMFDLENRYWLPGADFRVGTVLRGAEDSESGHRSGANSRRVAHDGGTSQFSDQ